MTGGAPSKEDAEPQDGRSAPAWAVVLADGSHVLVRDVEFDALAAIAKAEKVPELASIVDDPMRRGSVAAAVYRHASKARGLAREPHATLAELRSRFALVPAPVMDDAFFGLVEEIRRERADDTGDIGDPDEFMEEMRRRAAAYQWAVILPDGTRRNLCDLEWALLEIVGARHGRSVAEVEDRPRGGDGAFTADLWASICENQEQPSSTEGMTFAEVWARFVWVDNDKPLLPEVPPCPREELPEGEGPATD